MSGEFFQLARNVDVLPLALKLQHAPHLWDENKTRTTFENSPHRDSSDIWIRFRAPEELVRGAGPRMGALYRRLGAEPAGEMFTMELQEAS